jgi:uncharacterized lipoprotein
MRQFQIDPNNGMRTSARLVLIASMAALVVGVSGCHWFSKRDSAYQMSPESRPLEVPPDLDRPTAEGAVPAPDAGTQSVTRSEMATTTQAAPSSNSGFTIAGDRDDVFNKVGAALAGTQGVTIASKAQLLGTYDVSYQGSDFLIRVTKVDAGVYVSAVDPRGLPAGSAAAAQLIASLKATLGG